MGDLIEITTICLDWELAGSTPPDTTRWERTLTEKLAILGVSIVPDDCDVTLRFAMTTSRTSSIYGIKKLTCWTGEAIQAEASLLIDAQVLQTWSLADRMTPPPAEIRPTECFDEDEPLGPNKEERFDWWHALFSEVFGIAADLGFWVDDAPYEAMDVGPRCWEGLPTESDVQAIASLLMSEFWERTREWLGQCIPDDGDGRGALRPLVPYLVAGDLREMLEVITGEQFGSREEWWAWWEDQE